MVTKEGKSGVSFAVRAIAAQHRVDHRTLARAAAEGLDVIRGEAVRQRVARALEDLAKALAAAENAPVSSRRA